ncbi:MAG: hypothetical protein KatS3mg108_1190 [Isosphaeraceae bacterium]|jgi:hypothetical protein|nr:MAG: hypothetical protein KatS3mg108_1190 [Isosphaeraceae bacterium]
MSRENRITFGFVAVAAALMATAVLASRPAAVVDESSRELGQPLFPALSLPSQAASLEVVEYDASTGMPVRFEVALRDGRWVIPSHSNYPADARDRLARTAAGIFDLKHDSIRGDRPEDHKSMGVLDPLDESVISPEGVGRRITIRDRDGNPLADLILGKPVPGQEGHRFVRRPGQNRVYGVKIDNLDLSTRFSDWIETDLLQINPSSVQAVTFDPHKVDIVARRVDPGEPVTVIKKDPPPPPGESPWMIDGLPPTEEVNPEVMSTLTSTLAGLRIVGVRPKPPELSAWLKADPDQRGPLEERAAVSLQNRGFYILNGRFLSADGDAYVTCSDGVVYALRFGGVTFARGESLSAGSDEEQAGSTAEPSSSTNSGAVESRYLFVTASFDADAVAKPKPRPKPVAGELPADVFAKTAAERRAEAEREAAAEKAEQEAYQRRLKDGEERAKKLSERFADWYYVVPGDAYRKIVLDRKALVRTKTTPAPAVAPPPVEPISP